MTAQSFRFAITLGLVLQFLPTHAATVAWKSPVSGNWSEGANWSSGAPPAPADTALINLNGTYTVTINSPVTVDRVQIGSASGQPTLTIAAGSLTAAGNSLVQSNALLNLANGELRGTGTFRIEGTLDWTGGNMREDGTTVFAPGSSVTIHNPVQKLHYERTIRNQTSVVWRDDTAFYVGFGARWINEPGSVVDAQLPSAIIYNGGAEALFLNQGTWKRTGPAGQGYIDYAVSNTGVVQVESGRTAFRHQYVQTEGRTLLAGGDLDGPASLLAEGGELEGAGEVATSVRIGGALKPGRPLGRLNIGGLLTNTPASQSFFALGGSPAGTNNDQVIVTGPAYVGGELNLELANGYEPGGADVFVLVSGAARFGTYGITNAPPGYAADLQYTSTNVTVRLLKTGVPPPSIQTQPASLAVTNGQPAGFAVVASGQALSYQWRFNGAPIANATNASLNIPAANFPDDGLYSVRVANVGGAILSSNAVLTVIPASLDAGLTARYPLDGNFNDVIGGRHGRPSIAFPFTNGVLGQAARLNGGGRVELGATSGEPLVSSDSAFSASFWIRPRAYAPMVPLRLATAVGEFSLVLGVQPGNPSLAFGFVGQPVLQSFDSRAYVATNAGCWLHVAVVYRGGSRSLLSSYQAFVQGTAVNLAQGGLIGPGSSSSYLGLNLNGSGPELVNDLDEVRIYQRALRPEDAATLASGRPGCPPEFAVQPPPLTSLEIHSSLSFTPLVWGDTPLGYQWFLNGQRMPNQTNAPLPLADISLANAGTYQLVASNVHGTATSTPAVLKVTLPPPSGLVSFNLGTFDDFYGASFFNLLQGYTVTRAGAVWVTSNGGTSWTLSRTGATNDLYAIHAVGPVVYAAGAGGWVGVSTNGGGSWLELPTPTRERLTSLSFLEPNLGYAVGERGTILYYDGTQWISQSLPSGIHLYSVAYAGNAGIVWTVGQGGALYYRNTLDLSSSWIEVVSGTTETLRAIRFLNESFGYAVGDHGTILVYRNGTWIPAQSGTSVNLHSIVIADAQTAFAAGDGGLVLRTTDGGVTWEGLSAGQDASLYALDFRDGRFFGFGGGGFAFGFSTPRIPVNQPPVVAILSPTNHEAFLACFEIPILAQAADPDGSVTNVQFFRGPIKLAEFSQPPRPGRPFRTTFRTDVFGSYELRAVATDNLGAVSVSAPVTVDVVPPPLHVAVAEAYTTNTGCTVCFLGLTGSNYVFQGTRDLTPPVRWTSLSTNRMPELLLRVTDASATNLPFRFYRFLRQP